MIINHNMSALGSYRQLSTNSSNQAKSMEKLSSGLRINRAGDDAAGLAISEKMRSQIRGLDQASRNAQDGISMIQTAEGALNETHSILQRMRELAVQGSTDTNNQDDRNQIQKEMNQLTSEINRIGNTTEFNTKKLLNGQAAHTDATATKVVGGSVPGSINLVASPTKGNAVGTALTGTLDIHGNIGATATGSTAYASHASVGGGPNVAADSNELTVTLNGITKTVALNVADYSASAPSILTGDDFATDIQNKLNAVGAFGPGAVTVGFDANNKLQIKTANAADTLSVNGGNAMTHLGTVTTAAGQTANTSLSVSVNGVAKTINLAAGSYDTTNAGQMGTLMTDLNTKLDTAYGAGNAVATWDATNKQIKIESQTTGSTSTVNGFSGAAASALGLSSATSTNGLDKNDVLTLNVDGTTVTANLGSGVSDSNVIAANIQSAITAAGKSANVSYSDGKLSITDNTLGSAGSISVTDNASAKALGLSNTKGMTSTTGQNAANNDLTLQIGANHGQGMAINVSDMRSVALGISGSVSGGAASVAGANFGTTQNVTNGTDNNPAEYSLDVSSASKASAAVEVLDNAIKSVSDERSKLGAYQNRLEHTINNLNTSSENLTSAESRIRDTDMAKTVMENTKNGILAQAAQAMLAQANQAPQQVLQLLR